MADELRGFEDPRKVLARHGLRAKRRFSQNFLISRHAVGEIARAVGDAPGGVVVELGAGLGTLTAALLENGARVIAVERDRDMLAVLRQDLAPRGALVLEADAASLDYAALAREHGAPLHVVGNIPYAITGSILRNLLAAKQVVPRAVLMVQREVAERLRAAPGTREYGALTVFVGAAYAVSSVLKLPPACFHPPPKVHSRVVALDRREPALAEETPAFSRTVRAVFQSRRKTLRNALLHAWPAPAVEVALAALGLAPAVRGETLSVEALARLAAELEQATC